MQSTPVGLTFTADAVSAAMENNDKSPFDAAYEQLNNLSPENALEAALADTFRLHFQGATAAQGRAKQALIQDHVGLRVPDDIAYVDACAQAVAVAQAFSLLRSATSEDDQAAWLDAYAALLDTLWQAETPALLDRIWQMVVTLVGGAVLQQEDVVTAASDRFREIVSQEIHPEGYFPAMVEKSDSGALQRQVMGAKGLVLAAEVASHVGVDLWNYEVRGISAKTAAIYAAAFFEYREQWKWDEVPDEETNDTFYRGNGAFLELLNRQLRPEVLRTTLDQLRPLYDPYGGGFTTLTHAPPPRRGLFGWRR